MGRFKRFRFSVPTVLLWNFYFSCFYPFLTEKGAVPVPVPEKRFRRFLFLFRFLEKRFRRFRFLVPVRLRVILRLFFCWATESLTLHLTRTTLKWSGRPLVSFKEQCNGCKAQQRGRIESARWEQPAFSTPRVKHLFSKATLPDVPHVSCFLALIVCILHILHAFGCIVAFFICFAGCSVFI